ncbi:uncharacterized protein ISCGN_006078, partial [Ixodes scapularis]
MSSVGAVIAAQPGRGDRHDASTSDYQIILPPLPTGAAVLNTVFLHADIRGRPYRVEDFRDALGHLELLPGVLALGAFQMNHVWAVTFKSPEGKRKTLAAGDLVVKGRRCIVVDPGNRDIRVKLHWLLYHVPDDEVKAALAPYGTVTEMGTEKWRVQGVMDCGSMTRTAVIRLNPGLGLDKLPHQLRIAGGQVLVVAPGRAPLCLRCERTGHIRRDCRAPKCQSCHRIGHDAAHCVKTYATATGPGAGQANADHLMDEADAEETIKGAGPSTGTPVSGTSQQVDPPGLEHPLKTTDAATSANLAVASARKDKATTGRDEVSTKGAPMKATEGQQSNEVNMVDASALASKRPREQESDTSKVDNDASQSEPP